MRDQFFALARLIAFSMFGLNIGLKAVFVYTIWKTRDQFPSRWDWTLRTLFLSGNALIFVSYMLIMAQRVEMRPPFNWLAFITFYIGAVVTIVLLIHGIRRERHRYYESKKEK